MNNLNLSMPRLAQTVQELSRICQGSLTVEQNIEFFFSMLSEAGVDAHASKRAEYWLKYVKQGKITAAWMVLGFKLERMARAAGLRDDLFGKLEKALRVETDHGILLLQLDGFVVADWSHTGKCRFWLNKNAECPELFAKSYTRNQLFLTSDHVQQHYFSAQGLWQQDADAWIANHLKA